MDPANSDQMEEESGPSEMLSVAEQASYKLLDYEVVMFQELLAEDGLLVTARGLGIERVILNFLRLYCDPSTLVIVINVTPSEEEYFLDELRVSGVKNLPKTITNETGASERAAIYLKGGVLFVTSQILVFDLLNNKLPAHLVTGIMINKAHRVSESGMESFILRLYRMSNKNGFIKAFSESPNSFTSGFFQVEKVMKNLFLRKLYLWPRDFSLDNELVAQHIVSILSTCEAILSASFLQKKSEDVRSAMSILTRFHATVSALLERRKPEVVELHVSLTPLMAAVQMAILDLISSCLRELKRANQSIDSEELTVENAITKLFDKSLRSQLDPFWHQLSNRTRQLIADLKVLRILLLYLTQYDCVTLYTFLESLRTNERNSTNPSLWLFMDATNALFVNAKDRVFGSRKKKTNEEKEKKDNEEEWSGIEESPKWTALSEVLKEIEEENSAPDKDPGRVLIVASDERTCAQLREYLSNGAESLLRKLYTRLSKREGQGMEDFPFDAGKNENIEGEEISYRKRKRQGSNSSRGKKGRFQKKAAYDKKIIDNEIEGPNPTSEESQDADELETNDIVIGNSPTLRVKLMPNSLLVIHPLQGASDAHALLRTLYELEPKYVILYDAEMEFVRQLEVFKASRPGIPLRVYFMIYTGSVEEQRYLTTLRKEKDSFEVLIKQKAGMVIPEEREGKSDIALEMLRDSSKATDAVSSRKAGGREPEKKLSRKIIVDSREFRSELPSLIHRKGIDIEPVTLEVGDYILAPDMCVERKSVSDLIGSLNNGRLYSQVLSMTRYYKRSILLIEFDAKKSFSLQTRSSLRGEISIQDISSKLALLTIHFPKLRILWTQSPYATAELFEELKANYPDPDAKTAASIGIDAESVSSDFKYTIGPQDFVRKMPGINTKNYKLILNNVEDLKDLASRTESNLSQLLCNDQNGQEDRDVRLDCVPSLGRPGERLKTTKKKYFRFRDCAARGHSAGTLIPNEEPRKKRG